MKRIVAILLALMMTLSMSSALAAGKLQVEKESFHVTTDRTYTYYSLYAKVTNVGDEPLGIAAGTFEVYDEKGNIIGSSNSVSSYPQFLQPGEYGYVAFRDGHETDQSGPAADYKMSITDAPPMLPLVAHKFPCTFSYEEDAEIIVATVTNDLEMELFSIQVICAMLDAEGNILYLDLQYLLQDESIMPGTSKDFAFFVDSDLTPASYDVYAYYVIPQ